MSAFGGKADVIQGVGECPLLAISRHKDEGLKSKNFQNRGYGVVLESVQISLGILRISGQPQRGTENGSFPYMPSRLLRQPGLAEAVKNPFQVPGILVKLALRVILQSVVGPWLHEFGQRSLRLFLPA